MKPGICRLGLMEKAEGYWKFKTLQNKKEKELLFHTKVRLFVHSFEENNAAGGRFAISIASVGISA